MTTNLYNPSKEYRGGVDAGMVTIADPDELLDSQNRSLLQPWKRLIRSNRKIVSHRDINGEAVLIKVSDRPCSFRISFKKFPKSYDMEPYKLIILSDLSYDVNTTTRENRILTTSGYLLITDPCYFVPKDSTHYDNRTKELDQKWDNWCRHDKHKYNSNGYLLYASFDRDDGEFGVYMQGDSIIVNAVFGYDR